MTKYKDPSYVFDTATGQLFFETRMSKQIIGDVDLAVAWSSDEDGSACLQKHGSSELVKITADKIRAIAPTVKVVEIPWEAISHPEAGPRIIEEINRCISTSGYVGRIEEKLREISDDVSVHIFPRFTSEPAAGMDM